MNKVEVLEDRTQKEMFRMMLGRWEGHSVRATGLADFDKLRLAVAESGIIVEKFRSGKSIQRELYPLTGSRLIGSVYLFPTSLYFVKDIHPQKLVLGKGVFGSEIEFQIELNRVDKK